MVATDSANGSISSDNYSYLQKYVHHRTGIVLDGDKQYLLDSRLGPILRKRGMTDLNSLCALLRATQDAGLQRDVLEAMTTNETLFFRDQAPFEAMRSKILPDLVANNARNRTISIWSAAASTGQEIYSIAMLLLEAGLGDWKLKLLGTDYSEHVLERARAGKYMQIEVNRGLPAAMLVRYFSRKNLEWEIRPEVRSLVQFQQQDLRGNLSQLGPFDIVFCRNVLIYFDMPTKQSVLRQIAATLPTGGYLFLGSTEPLLNLDCPYDRTQIGQSVVYRRR